MYQFPASTTIKGPGATRKQIWDNAVHKADGEYAQTIHNICCNNWCVVLSVYFLHSFSLVSNARHPSPFLYNCSPVIVCVNFFFRRAMSKSPPRGVGAAIDGAQLFDAGSLVAHHHAGAIRFLRRLSLHLPTVSRDPRNHFVHQHLRTFQSLNYKKNEFIFLLLSPSSFFFISEANRT